MAPASPASSIHGEATILTTTVTVIHHVVNLILVGLMVVMLILEALR